MGVGPFNRDVSPRFMVVSAHSYHRLFSSILIPSLLEHVIFLFVVAWKRARKIYNESLGEMFGPKRGYLFALFLPGHHSAIGGRFSLESEGIL